MIDFLKATSLEVEAYIKANFLKNVDVDYLQSGMLHLFNSGGKRIRPGLLTLFGLNCGADKAALIPLASACEIFHTWTLVHDDIIDNDDSRRGRSTTHIMLDQFAVDHFSKPTDSFGSNMAILSGDLQQAWVYQLVLGARNEIGAEKCLLIIDELSSVLTSKLICGEAVDVEFEHRAPESSQKILEMMANKTSALLEFCAMTGVLVATEGATYDHPLVKKAGVFAKSAGLAFQLQDDILGIYGEARTVGKPIGSDLILGKHTLLRQYCQELASAKDFAVIESFVGRKALSLHELESARTIIRACGALKHVEDMARNMIDEAVLQLPNFPQNTYNAMLRELAEFMYQRSM